MRVRRLTEQKEQKPDVLNSIDNLLFWMGKDTLEGKHMLKIRSYIEKSLKRDELLENKLKKLKTLGLTQTMEYRVLIALKEV